MFLLALAVFAAVPSERWVHVGGAAGEFEEYLDTESLSRSGGRVTLWTRRDLLPSRGTAWNELEFDCAARTATVLAYVEDLGGTISHSNVRPHRAASPIAAGSIEDAIFKLACR